MADPISTRASSIAPMCIVPSSTTFRARCNFLRPQLHHPHRRLSHSASSGAAAAGGPREVPEGDEEVVVQEDKVVNVHDDHPSGDAASTEHKTEGKLLAGVGRPKPPDGRCEGIGGRGGIIHAAPPPAAPPPSSSG